MPKAFTLFACVVFPATASAADINILSGGAIEPGLHAAARQFEKQSGHHVNITFNTTPQIQKRIEAGEKFDIVIVPPSATDPFVKAGLLEGGGTNVGRVGMGAVVRPDAPLPNLASAETLKQSLVDADSVVFNRASTGIYFESLLKKMGVWGQVEPKTTRYPDGASVMEHVLKGKGREIGFGAITEILLYKDKGLRFVGPLPAEAQNYTSYIASLTSGGKASAAARDLVSYFATPDGKKWFAAAGVE